MKRILNVLMVAVVMGLVLAACSPSDATPKDAAMKCANHLKSGNYEALVNELAFNGEVSPEEMKQQKSLLVSVLKDKTEKSLEKQGKIKDVEFVSEQISEDGNTAVVKLNFIYGNGENEPTDFDLVKIDNKWKVTVKK